ncbi:MAG: internal scaffolding protein [Microviridae sp.]|nr:MAG: internal scaffolding protein [Microviridae sp.]
MKKQSDLEDFLNPKKQKPKKIEITEPVLWSVCCPYRRAVDYQNDGPSLTRQEFTEECDINAIMKKYEATGVMPQPGREPIYWDADAVPSNLQDAANAMIYANGLFMQLPAAVRKEFDNDAVKFVDFASNAENGPKLKEWGLTAPELAPGAPVRVEVVAPTPPTPAPPGEPPKP